MFKPFATHNKLNTQAPNLKAVLKKINNSRKYEFKLDNNQLHANILAGNFNIEMMYCNIRLNENQLILQTGLSKIAIFLFVFGWPLAFLGVVLFNLKSNYQQHVSIIGIGVGAIFLLSYLISRLVITIKNRSIKQELKKYNLI
jgi:hypothetical protein